MTDGLKQEVVVGDLVAHIDMRGYWRLCVILKIINDNQARLGPPRCLSQTRITMVLLWKKTKSLNTI